MPSITLATKTLAAFESAVRADQGAKWRGYLKQVMPALDDAYRSDPDAYRSDPDEGFRTHMGASVIGRECAREIWYSYRWATKPNFEGRMIRLFNRGHMEEGRMIALLLTIGVQFYQQDANGKQFRISEYGGLFGGSGDGVAVGIPDIAPGQAALAEFKTHNDKSFQKLIKEGVRVAKYEHWVQMQVYMRKMGLAVAVYFAVNKNDDHIHAELIYLDATAAATYIDRAGKIIPIYAPPAKINESVGWFGCKFCDHKPVCKQGAAPERNCRTCSFSSVNMDKGSWWCDNGDRQIAMLFGPKEGVSEAGETFELTKERQLKGCVYYQKNPNI